MYNYNIYIKVMKPGFLNIGKVTTGYRYVSYICKFYILSCHYNNTSLDHNLKLNTYLLLCSV